MALKLDILANTRQFVSEMKKSGASVEDISDALNDLIRDGDKAGDKLEDSFRDAARQAKKLGDAGEKAGKDVKKGFDKAGDGAQDFKQEANQSLRETAASISSVEDGLGAVQEIAANAFVGFGPVGAGVGLVAALGFGLLLENLNQQNEAIQKQKEFYADAYQTATEEGRKYIDSLTIQREANDILFNPDRVNEYNQAVEQSIKIGLDANTLVLARAGDQEALKTVIEATTRAQEDLGVSIQGAGKFAIDTNKREMSDLNAIQHQYEAIGDLHQQNAERARASQEISNDLARQERDNLDKLANAHSAAQDRIRADASKPVRVPLVVDDSALRRWRYVPPPITVQVRGVDSRGRTLF